MARHSATTPLPADAPWTARRGVRPRTAAILLALVFCAALLASMLGAGAGPAITP